MNSKRLYLLAFALLITFTLSSQEQKNGIISITRNKWRLGPINERHIPNDEAICYGLIVPFQVGPNTAAAFVNRGVYNKNRNSDSEDGNDFFFFDAPENICPENVIPLNRSGVEMEPGFEGKRYFNRFPMLGGFVPHGARISGQPHPHAGSGFSLSMVITYPVAADGTFSWRPSPIRSYFELFQLAYDGKKLQIVSKSKIPNKLEVPDSKWVIIAAGLSMAIPDAADLLFPVLAVVRGE